MTEQLGYISPEQIKGYTQPKSQNEKSNKLTKEIINYIILMGGHAQRINVQAIKNRKSTNIGHSDIDAIYRGYSLKIEIKVKDKLLPSQITFKNSVLNADGQYWEVRNFEEFITAFKKFRIEKYSSLKY